MTYTVVKGDTLSKIASRFDTTVAQLVEWNMRQYPSLVDNPGLIRPGWVLVVAAEPEPEPDYYTKAEVDAVVATLEAKMDELDGRVTVLEASAHVHDSEPDPEPDPEPEPEPEPEPPSGSYPTSPDQVGLTIPKASLTPYTGPLTITSDRTLEGYRFDLGGGHLTITAGNVTLRNCWIKGGGFWNVLVRAGATLTIEDCEIGDPSQVGERGIGGDGRIIARRLYIHSVEDGIKMSPDSIFEDCWVGNLASSRPSPHADACQNDGGASNVVIRRCYLDVHGAPGSTSAVMIKADLGPIDNVLVEDCYLNGGTYTVYNRRGNSGSMPVGTIVRRCTFGPDHDFGYVSNDAADLVWENNVDHLGNPIDGP